MISVEWRFASYTVQATVSAQDGLLAVLKMGAFSYQAKVEGLPSVSYDKLVRIPFRETFYPVVSRSADDNWRVRFETRGLGGGCFDWLCCCLGSGEKADYGNRYQLAPTYSSSVRNRYTPINNTSVHDTKSSTNSIASLRITAMEWAILEAHPIMMVNNRTQMSLAMKIDTKMERVWSVGDETVQDLLWSEEESYPIIRVMLDLIRKPNTKIPWDQPFILKSLMDDEGNRLPGVSLLFQVSETEIREQVIESEFPFSV